MSPENRDKCHRVLGFFFLKSEITPQISFWIVRNLSSPYIIIFIHNSYYCDIYLLFIKYLQYPQGWKQNSRGDYSLCLIDYSLVLFYMTVPECTIFSLMAFHTVLKEAVSPQREISLTLKKKKKHLIRN